MESVFAGLWGKEKGMSRTVIVLKGDQTGQELLEEALRVLDLL